MLNDILEKQATEQRRTQNFLKYALGKRECKNEAELKAQIKQGKYDPKNDPLMPRLFRKFDASKSTIISSKRGRFSEKSFSQFDNNKIYKSGQGYGS